MTVSERSLDSDTRRNVLTYYLNLVVVAVVGFVVNPLLLSALGPLLFGVWKSLQRYLDFATVADGRASQALKWIVASRTTLTDLERRRDVGAAIIVWLRWLPAATLVVAGVTVAVPLLIKGIPEDAQSLAYTTAAILAANTVLAGLLYIPDSVLTGVNQAYKSYLITTLAFIVSNGAMIVAAFAGWSLWSLAVIVLVGAIANAGLTLRVARRAVPWWGVSRPTAPDLRRVHGYSAWTLGGAVVDKLFLASELIVISVMVGAVAVAQYTFTTYVMQFVISIAVVTASGFTPMLGSQLGASDFSAAAERARSIRHLVIGVAVLGSSAVLAFNGAFVTMWVGADQYLGTTINTLLVVCGLLLAFIRMDGQILDVTMRIAPKVVIGLVTSAGGILAGCIGFAVTHDLAVALVAVIVVRLVCNVAYPMFVARSIPQSAVPWRPVILAGALLVVSFIIGPLTQSGETLVRSGLTVGWVSLAGVVAWSGLVPRNTVRALLTRRASR
jgi:O-antigen/teichoic acid export membrane protein